MAEHSEDYIFGRPTKYLESFKQEAIDFIGSGKSVTQFAKHIGVSKATIYSWANDKPDFLDALKLAQDWSQSVWEDKLEEMMYSREVNAPLVKLYFANRFNWTDKQQEVSASTDAQPLEVNFEVRPAVGDVEITNANS